MERKLTREVQILRAEIEQLKEEKLMKETLGKNKGSVDVEVEILEEEVFRLVDENCQLKRQLKDILE